MGPMRWLALGLVVTAWACSSPREPAIRVEARFGSFVPRCLELIATEASPPRRQSRVTVLREQLDSSEGATLAVFPAEGWAAYLELELRSFEGGCTGDPIERIRREEPLRARFDPVPVWEITFAAQDEDGDGFAAALPGILGTDCDDHAPLSSPSGTEDCGREDRDCDGLIGCLDPDCGACNQPPSPCHSAPGTCSVDGGCSYSIALAKPCDGGVCRSNGTCAPGEANCQDGLDDDDDGKIDCLDSDCAAQACDDLAPCTVNDLCRSDGGCQGSPMACTTPPGGPCWNAAGVCDAGACVYSVTTGASCSDGTDCTSGDTCRADGGCQGAPISCATPPNAQCYAAAGACLLDAGTCSYTPQPGKACDDGNSCSASDVCQPSGTCSGTVYSCSTPPGECFDPGVCAGDGGCTFAARLGAACSTGYCNASGACIAPAVFLYSPFNFDPSQHSPNGPVTLSGCDAIFDSSGATPAFTTWCGGNPPGIGLDSNVVVLAMDALSISADSSLTIVGSRPVVLAVYGSATIGGPIWANSVTAAPARKGPGGSPAACSGDGLAGSDQGGGGGGGGGAGYASNGGDGGVNSAMPATAGAGGSSWGGSPSPLRGGCEGGRGGAASGTQPALGGAGGGALQISAAGHLEIDAVISTSGAGGAPGAAKAGSQPGGAGGGAGGTLVLEAETLQLTSNAILTANGGGGGGGANNATASPGQDGSPDNSNPAPGGNGEGGGAAGGPGGARQTLPGSGGASNRGAGGGGGATGRIFLRHNNTGTGCIDQANVISPQPSRSQCP